MLLTKKKKKWLSSKEKLNQKSLYGVSLLLIYIYTHETKIPASATGGDSLCSSQLRCLILESVNAKGRQGKVEPLDLWKYSCNNHHHLWKLCFCLKYLTYYYSAVCCWITANECFSICSWWALLWGFRLWICCLLYGASLFLLYHYLLIWFILLSQLFCCDA